MQTKLFFKISVDFSMTIILLLLMAYEMVGRTAHEWLGIGMFLLMIAHHGLNAHWSRNILKGKYTKRRLFQNALTGCILIAMLGSMVSGIILSESVFSFLNIRNGREMARTIHMLSAYWGYVLMSVHIGFHWSMLAANIRKNFALSEKQNKILCFLGCVIAIYGAYAFINRRFLEYMFLRTHFAFFDFEEPLLVFILDYAAVMVLFIFLGHYAIQKGRKQKNH